MKNFIVAAALLFAVLQANAEVIASLPNEAGGQILLTNAKGPCKNGLLMMSTVKSGEYLQGCWSPYDEQVFVVYADGSSRMYPMEGFTLRTRQQVKPRSQSL
jgi:hypothetical protein